MSDAVEEGHEGMNRIVWQKVWNDEGWRSSIHYLPNANHYQFFCPKHEKQRSLLPSKVATAELKNLQCTPILSCRESWFLQLTMLDLQIILIKNHNPTNYPIKSKETSKQNKALYLYHILAKQPLSNMFLINTLVWRI